MLEKLTSFAFGIAFVLLAFLLFHKEKFGYVLPAAAFSLIACLAAQSWFQGVFTTGLLSMARQYGEKLDEFQKTTAKMQAELTEQQSKVLKAQRELTEAQSKIQSQQKKIESVEFALRLQDFA